MPTARTRKPRATRTRTDVETDMDALQERTSNAEQLDPQAAKLAGEHAAATRAGVKGLSIDAIVAKGASLGLDIQRTLGGLTEQCVAKATELKTLQDAVELESDELERLYDLDVASASTQILIQDHEAKKAAFEKQEEEARAQWADEVNAHTKAVRERDAILADQRKKEVEEYSYRAQRERALAEDAFKEKVRIQERDHAERQSLFEKSLSERRALIDKEEAEITALKARVAGIDEEIRKAAAKDTAIITGAMKRDHEHELILLKKDHAAAIGLEQQKNVSFEASNKTLAEQVVKLQGQLDAAKDQVAQIATKAIEGASGQAALSKVMELQQNGSQQRAGTKS